MHKDMNHVSLVGRLTRDIEMRYTPNGLAVGRLALAVNRKVKKGDSWEAEASFFDVTIFGKMAEALQRYLTKGTQTAVSGELKQERWDQDGQKRSKVVIIAQDLQLLGSPRQEGQAAQGAYSAPPPQQQPQQQYNRPRTHAEFSGVQPPKPEADLFTGPEDFDDDIPF